VDDIAIVEAFLTAYWSNDHEHTLSFIADDFVWENVAAPDAPIVSKAAMRETLVNRNKGFPEAVDSGHHETVTAIADDSGTVLHERLDEWSLRGSQMNCPCCARFHVRGGKIQLWRDYFDIGYVARQFCAAGVPFDTPS
jgi:limonene-1,2-epoxide hydrolase